MNASCPDLSDNLLLFYCFTYSKSICLECFTNGTHKNHNYQEKCFYLLNSKHLADKILEKLIKDPYNDYKIEDDLSNLKSKVNNEIFPELIEMLKKCQQQFNLLIDRYNKVNKTSLNNIRDSIRDIKICCI